MLNFLVENTHFKCSAAMREMLGPLRKNKGRFLGLFLVPIERHLLSHDGALLWMAFLHTLLPEVPGDDLAAALNIIASTYDSDHSNKIGVHFETEEDEDSDPDSD